MFFFLLSKQTTRAKGKKEDVKEAATDAKRTGAFTREEVTSWPSTGSVDQRQGAPMSSAEKGFETFARMREREREGEREGETENRARRIPRSCAGRLGREPRVCDPADTLACRSPELLFSTICVHYITMIQQIRMQSVPHAVGLGMQMRTGNRRGWGGACFSLFLFFCSMWSTADCLCESSCFVIGPIISCPSVPLLLKRVCRDLSFKRIDTLVRFGSESPAYTEIWTD